MINEHALAAAIRRAELRLRRSIIIHGQGVRIALFWGDHRAERTHLCHMDRAERRLWRLCRQAERAKGAAAYAALSAEQTLREAASWTDAA